MTKWFTYIVLLLICALRSLSAAAKKTDDRPVASSTFSYVTRFTTTTDTTLKTTKQIKQLEKEEKKKIKEVAKAKRQLKPEKIDDSGITTDTRIKPKRQRRPAGLERPPEIPRRNGN